MRVWGRGSSSANPLDLGGERSDLACGWLAARHFRYKPSGACGLRESDPLANPHGESRRVMFGQRFGDLARDKRASNAAGQDEPPNELGTETSCLRKPPPLVGPGPTPQEGRLRPPHPPIAFRH